MKLYHGTGAGHLPCILEQGLKPRGKKAGNWQHTTESNPNAVYLTDAYALYYAFSAAKPGEEDMVVLELDTAKLAPFFMVPDEDFLEQATRKSGPAPLDKSMHYRTKWYRRRLLRFGEYWMESVKHLGNCAYHGEIPVTAITRYVVIPHARAFELFMAGMDPNISLLNYKIVGDKYRNWIRWAFGDPLVSSEQENLIIRDSATYMSQISREGIQVFTHGVGGQ